MQAPMRNAQAGRYSATEAAISGDLELGKVFPKKHGGFMDDLFWLSEYT